MLRLFAKFAGHPLDIEQSVFESEKATGHRNRAIAYMMLNTGMIRRQPEDILDIYFRQCAINVTCRDLAVMAATLPMRTSSCWPCATPTSRQHWPA